MNTDKISHILLKELARRKMTEYFLETKGVNLKSKLYPPSIMDMVKSIPLLQEEIEVVPFVISQNPRTRSVTIGWNLFVGGITRMFMGTTSHSDIYELKQTVMTGQLPLQTVGQSRCTPEKVIEFIIRNGKFIPNKPINQTIQDNNPISMSGNYDYRNMAA